MLATIKKNHRKQTQNQNLEKVTLIVLHGIS